MIHEKRAEIRRVTRIGLKLWSNKEEASLSGEMRDCNLPINGFIDLAVLLTMTPMRMSREPMRAT